MNILRESMYKKMVFSILAIIMLVPAVSEAANYYVSTSGNDSNSGTEASPFLTIQRAADVAGPGDTAYIRAGTYNETGRTNPSFNNPPRGIVVRGGQAGSPVTFKAYPGEERQVIVDLCTTGPTDNCPQTTAARQNAGFILRPGTHYVTIEGLEIKNAGIAGVWVSSSPGEQYTYGVVIRNNHIHHIWGSAGNNVGGVRPDLTDGVLIEGNTIHDIVVDGSGSHNASGVHTYIARNATIRNNEFYNARNGVFEKWPDPQKGLNVIGNLIHDVNTGIRIGGATGSDVAHDTQITQNVVFNATMCVRTVPELIPPTTLLQIWNNTFVDCPVGIDVAYFPDTRVWNNIIATSVGSGSDYTTVLLQVGNHQDITYSDYNLYYFYPSIPSGYRPFAIGESGTTLYSLDQWRALGTDTNFRNGDPLFVNKSTHDLNLQSNSPARGTGYSGSDIGAFGNVLSVTPTPGGGDTGGNTGGDSSSSGGSGCGFVKDDNGKGQKTKGEGLALMIMLIISLAGLAIAKKYFSRLFKWYSH